MNDDELTPSELGRNRRRDRDAEAQQRAPMRPGMGKVFRQIQEVQAKKAEEPGEVGGRRRSTRPKPNKHV